MYRGAKFYRTIQLFSTNSYFWSGYLRLTLNFTVCIVEPISPDSSSQLGLDLKSCRCCCRIFEMFRTPLLQLQANKFPALLAFFAVSSCIGTLQLDSQVRLSLSHSKRPRTHLRHPDLQTGVHTKTAILNLSCRIAPTNTFVRLRCSGQQYTYLGEY